MSLRLGEVGRFTGARQGETRRDSSQLRIWQSGLADTLCCRVHYRAEALFYTEAQIGRSGCGFAKHLTRQCAQPRAAASATAVDAEQKQIGVHLLVPSVTIMAIDQIKNKLSSRVCLLECRRFDVAV